MGANFGIIRSLDENIRDKKVKYTTTFLERKDKNGL